MIFDFDICFELCGLVPTEFNLGSKSNRLFRLAHPYFE